MSANALWFYERGDQLIARNSAGRPVMAWPAKEDIGRTLAHLLNAAPDLAGALLSSGGVGPGGGSDRCTTSTSRR